MKSMLSALRLVLTVCLCAVLIFSSVVSSAAALPFKDQPMKNEAGKVAKEYEATAKETIDRGGLQSLEEVRDRSKGGAPNEVQGTVGIDDMKRPSNSQGQSVEDQIKQGLDKATDSAKDLVK